MSIYQNENTYFVAQKDSAAVGKGAGSQSDGYCTAANEKGQFFSSVTVYNRSQNTFLTL